MTEPTTSEPSPTPPTPDEQTSNYLKGLMKEALNEFIAENAPPPNRTDRPTSFLDSIINFGRQ